MSIVIDKRISIPSLVERQISAKEFSDTMDHFHEESAVREWWEIPVRVSASIRTTMTNKVLATLVDEEVADVVMTSEVKSVDGLSGFHLLIANIRSMFDMTFTDLDYRGVMSVSVLQPMGFIEQDDSLTVYFHVIITDEDEDNLIKYFDRGGFLDISSLPSFTTLSPLSKMVLPTLKIVG